MDKDGEKERGRVGEWGRKEDGTGRKGGKGAVDNVAVCFVGFSQFAFFFIKQN